MVTSREILDIVEIAYYSPVLFIAIFVALKHGFRREDGWFFMIVLSLLRLIGGSTGIAAVHSPTNTSLIACTIVCSTIGLAPLLLALLAFTGRIHKGMTHGPPVPQRFMKLLFVPITIGLILGILAGTDRFSSNPKDVNTSHTYSKVTSLLYLGSLIGIAAVIALTALHFRHIAPGESKLLFAGIAALPFLFVRIAYVIISAFDYNNPDFSVFTTKNTAVIIQAIMSLLMEFIVVAIYLVAGILTPPVPKAQRSDPQNIDAERYPSKNNSSSY